MEIRNYVTGLQHIGIPTADLDETLLFYTELGFDVALATKNPDSGARVIFLQLGDLVVKAYEQIQTAMCHGGIDHFAIAVTDIEAVYDTVCKHALNTLEDEIHFLPFWDKGVRFFTIEGPNKEKIAFTQRL